MRRPSPSTDGLCSRIEGACANDTDSLALYRVLWAVFVLALATPKFSWLGDVPQGFFSPPALSLAALFSGFPPKAVFVALDIALVLAIAAVGLGIKARIAAVVTVVLVVLGSSFHYSFGKIDHGFILWAALICLSRTNWSTRYALIPDKPVSESQARLAMALAGLMLAFGMFTAGFPKLLFWVDFDLSTGGFLSWFYHGYFTLGRQLLAAPLVLGFPPALFEAFDYAAALFEVAALGCLVNGRKSWRLWLVICAAFHFGCAMFLNISFYPHAILYLMFVPIAALPLLKHWRMQYAPALITILAALQLWQVYAGSPAQMILAPTRESDVYWTLMISAVLWPAVVAAMGYVLLREAYTQVRPYTTTSHEPVFTLPRGEPWK